jgi:Xaa-Pro aminopeptidase
LVAAATPLLAQVSSVATLNKYGLFDEDRLPASFHKSRRDSIQAKMNGRSAALFLAAPMKNRANDVNYEYHQDPNFYYLTGHLQANAALLLFNEPVVIDGKTTKEIFFVEQKNPTKETWTGVRLGIEGAESILNFKTVYLIDSLSKVLDVVQASLDTLYFAPPYRGIKDHATNQQIDNATDVVDSLRRKYPSLNIYSPNRYLNRLRMIKTPEELALMRKAITISCKAHNAILQSSVPGMHEYEIQALGEYMFKKYGCEYTGYPCIVGSGNNSTILHYETNRRKTESGDFIEMDIGGEYHGYTADVTRSFPINGKFTPEQRAIYEIVLEAADSGIVAAKSGNRFRAPHDAAVKVIKAGLVRLGISEDGADYMKYFMHGTSHYLGLDVHDAGTLGLLEPNVVITVEPGIYIAAGSPCDVKWWKIGCRVEDDILITETGNENLSKSSPRTIPEIEALMKQN